MFYVYLEADNLRRLLITTLDVTSAQFFAAKYSQDLAGAVAIHTGATGRPRQPLAVFVKGVRVDAPASPPASGPSDQERHTDPG